MRILIVESNPAPVLAVIRARGGSDSGAAFAAVLREIRPATATGIAAPYGGPGPADLSVYDGAIFTGSAVDWETGDIRARPLAEMMERVFAAGLPCLGVCNGMLLAASVLGGVVGASPNGREDGIASGIRLTRAGRIHPMMAGRNDGFSAPCTHRDEVRALPAGAVLLAGNGHCPVQAIAVATGGADFWGTQYHPELSLANIAATLRHRGLSTPGRIADLTRAATDHAAAARLGTSVGEQSPAMRMTELTNWLDHVAARMGS